MRISVEANSVELLESNTFTAFDVLAPGLDAEAVVAALGSAGKLADEPGHVLVAVDGVRALAGPVDEAWEEQFQAMLAYAESRGWLDDSGEWITAHVSGS